MSLLIGEELRRLFHTFDYTAYRLEVRERYAVGYEIDAVHQFLAGQDVDLSYMESWLDLMISLRAKGKRVGRVRVISEPHSDYTRYGLWLCRYNVEAGEDIRYLSRDDSGDLPDHDYWLFDSSRLYKMWFNVDDDLLGAELVDDPAEIVQHCYWRDAAWHVAVPYNAYVETSTGAS